MHSSLQLWLTVGIFGITLVGILFERIDKSILTATGALLYLALGFITEQETKSFVDFETLSLLMGMMIIVGVASESGLFEWLSLKMLHVTKGQPLLIFILFLLNTLFLSSFLNNVTTILIILPLTIEIARNTGMNPRPLIIGEIFMANIGGLLTLIGDPVNTIIGSTVQLGMKDFLVNLSIPVFILTGFIMAVLYFSHRGNYRNIRGSFLRMLHNQLVIRLVEDKCRTKNLDPRFMILSFLVMAGTIVAFLFAETLGATPGLIALAGATATVLLNHRKIEHDHIFSKIEWKTLLFFAGLFVMVGALKKTGILEDIAMFLEHSSSSPAVLLAFLLVTTGVVSALIDNIPFVTIMIPVIRELQQSPLFSHSPEVLWWALALGAVIGGMSSPFGSSANIVALGLAKESGMKISTSAYMRYSVVISIVGLIISYIYLVTAYEL